MNKNYKTVNNSSINILKTFWQLITSKKLRTMINKNGIKTNYNTCLKFFFNKSTLGNKIKIV